MIPRLRRAECADGTQCHAFESVSVFHVYSAVSRLLFLRLLVRFREVELPHGLVLAVVAELYEQLWEHRAGVDQVDLVTAGRYPDHEREVNAVVAWKRNHLIDLLIIAEFESIDVFLPLWTGSGFAECLFERF